MEDLTLTDSDGDDVIFEWLEGSGMGIFSAEPATAHYGVENMKTLRDWLTAGIDAMDEQAHTESNDQFIRSMKTAQNIVAGWTQEDRTNNSIGFPSGVPLEGE